MFDAPCGDLNWMRYVLDEVSIDYIGGDIAPSALEIARRNRPSTDLRLFDICRDKFPDAELWHCRDALFHLSYDDIWQALSNAAVSSARLALLTTHRGRWMRNVDIRTGDWRHLDLERPPFSFPKAIHYLSDGDRTEFPRFVGVWSLGQLREVLAAK